MNSKALIIVGFLVAVGVALFLSRGKSDGMAGDGTSQRGSGASVTVTMVYGTEKQAWIEEALAAFKKQEPDINVQLVGKGSLDAAQGILDGKLQPTVWSPADSGVLRLLESDWRTKNQSDLFASGGEDAPQPLVITPLVYAVWADRAEVLVKASKSNNISFKTIHAAVSNNQGWPAVGGKPEWGFVKLGHTDPTRSNSGLQALLLMTFDYYGKQGGLQVGDLLDAKYQQFLQEAEKGVSRFEISTGTFMTDMVRFGPSKYDIALVYENLAISQLENAQGRWGSLKIYYPDVTLWSDHPAAILQATWVTDAQKQAARKWLAFLRSRPTQERALAYGFRPADPSVPLKTGDASNPFNRLAQYGIQVDVPPVAQVPEGAVLRNLLTLWSRTVGNR